MPPSYPARSAVFPTALYLALVTATAVLGWRVMIVGAPWRDTNASIAAAVGMLFGVAAWIRLRHLRAARLGLLTLVALAFVAITAWHGFRHARTVDELNPDVSAHIDERGTADTLLNRLRTIPGHRERLFPMLNTRMTESEIIANADALLDNRYQFYSYDPATLPKDLDWRENPFDDRSWNWTLHNMDYVVTLTRAYEATQDARYLVRAETLITDWIDDNAHPLFDPPSVFSWNDHSTAFRVLNWLYFLDVWKASDQVTAESFSSILSALLGHVLKLTRKDFYTANHNHGIDQDRALLAFSVMHPDFRDATTWRELGLGRLAEQIAFGVSPAGIHLEHSAAYHFYGLQQLSTALNFLTAWDVDHPTVTSLRRTVEKMATYAPDLVKPDGHLVQIGDTGVVPITQHHSLLSTLTSPPEALKQLLATGTTDRIPSHATAYPEEGYAIIRDLEHGDGSFRNSLYLFFSAGAHQKRAHRQADDLSFVLSVSGHEFLVDPGVYSYKIDEGRAYVVSAPAHNSVTIDHQSYQGWDTTLDAFDSSPEGTLIKGSQRNYPGFEHSRVLAYVLDRYLLVFDRVRPTSANAGNHHFEQLLHFSPAVTLTIPASANLQVANAAVADSSARVSIMQLGHTAPSMRIASGEHSPMQGWYSGEHAQLVPAPTLVSAIDDREAEFITLIDLSAAQTNDSNAPARWLDGGPPSEDSTVRIALPDGGTTRILSYDATNTRISLD